MKTCPLCHSNALRPEIMVAVDRDKRKIREKGNNHKERNEEKENRREGERVRRTAKYANTAHVNHHDRCMAHSRMKYQAADLNSALLI